MCKMLVSHGGGSMTTFSFVKTKNVSDAMSVFTFRCWMVSVILSENNIVWEWAADQLKKWTEILLANTDNLWTGYCWRTPTIHERKYCWRTPTIHERRYCWQTMTIHKRRYCWRTPVELLLLFSLKA